MFACTNHTDHADAARNRPAELQNPDGKMSPQEQAIDTAVRGFLDSGITTEEVAKAVVSAVKEEKLYILTHPQVVDGVRTRMEDILENRNPTGMPVF